MGREGLLTAPGSAGLSTLSSAAEPWVRDGGSDGGRLLFEAGGPAPHYSRALCFSGFVFICLFSILFFEKGDRVLNNENAKKKNLILNRLAFPL